MDTVTRLRGDIERMEKELERLKNELRQAETHMNEEYPNMPSHNSAGNTPWKWPLEAVDYERYARQLIIPQVGVHGQLRLKKASVLIVGAGGLGCPAAAYLAGAGIGTIGLTDGDIVEVSNLHRQIAHSTERVGILNPTIGYRAHHEHLTPQTAGSIVSQYDLVLDCTDHPTSRYLISDACVLYQKPLVFASALQTHGQLMVMNCPARPQGDRGGGPCYRCVFPKPSPPETVVSCGEGGILGPVVGVMGVLQALEGIKILAAGKHEQSYMTSPDENPIQHHMLLFSGHVATPFRSVRMAGRRKTCFACGPDSTLTKQSLEQGSVDYAHFCGILSVVDTLRPEERVSPKEYLERVRKDGGHERHLLLDVREAEHFQVASLDGAINVPYRKFSGTGVVDTRPEWLPAELLPSAPIFVVCRQGQDSQIVTRRLKEMGLDRGGERYIGDIKGGMRAWKADIDPTFPFT
ncbi:hypothetical protein jhhlp_007040 [Lomentospora prolificans]|uniref:Adenylyltransferase and sulfurtransferase uba4 n=1 Tax=Lomentospora prolificans TaxID=41688 RepID=A0A2N3N1K8_9PEZI|nr:hypothetical protein jhhlp_007040 [Lomentospora prolificans]